MRTACRSTGASALRTALLMDKVRKCIHVEPLSRAPMRLKAANYHGMLLQVLEGYYQGRGEAFWSRPQTWVTKC